MTMGMAMQLTCFAMSAAPAVAFGRNAHCVAPMLGSFAGGILAGLGYVYLFMFGEQIPDVYMITAEPGEHEGGDASSLHFPCNPGEHEGGDTSSLSPNTPFPLLPSHPSAI